VEPDYEKCIEISTQAAIREMILPGALTIITPCVLGFAFGPHVLGGYLAGVTVSGVLLAIFQSNAGGAWDNAKKSFEKGIDINGQTYYKGSDPHKAAVIGDTVGDPFKDTSGPSMNILIKLSCIVALIIATRIANVNTIHEAADVSNHAAMMMIDSTGDHSCDASGVCKMDGEAAGDHDHMAHDKNDPCCTPEAKKTEHPEPVEQ
jgi:K(+)-stimulated pyrophosphate-energized sodium pump